MPQSNDEVAAKYRALTDGLIDAPRQRAIEDFVRDLERQGDLRPLLALLAPTVAAPF
jgi:aconitate decarboxylase